MTIGVSTLPELPMDATDRNRTSPFAFTGNKFEFRAVGSSQTVASANIAINTIVSESLDYMATKLEEAAKNPDSFMKNLQSILQQEIKANKRIIFNGDNYTDEWKKEAKKRGLPNLESTVAALPSFITKKTVEVFEKYKVLSEIEVESRYEIMLENYCKAVKIEADVCAEMAQSLILPPCIEYQKELAKAITLTKSVDAKSVLAGQKEILKRVTKLNSDLYGAIENLVKEKGKAGNGPDHLAISKNWHQKVLPAMLKVRELADQLEVLVDDRLWILPKYKEMLFLY
jgi:glutamine synthetase